MVMMRVGWPFPRHNIFFWSASGFGAIVLLLVAFNIGGAFFTTLIGFAFPAYKSLVAIESTNKADDTQWLAYWVMFASFSVAELFLDLGTHVPFYYLAKLVFLMWCFLPSTQGALLIYNRSLRPLVLQYASIPAAPAGMSPSPGFAFLICCYSPCAIPVSHSLSRH